jgi:arylamine N-acetyltransferase
MRSTRLPLPLNRSTHSWGDPSDLTSGHFTQSLSHRGAAVIAMSTTGFFMTSSPRLGIKLLRSVADVGFGAQTSTAPLRLEPGLTQATSHGTYRIMQTGSEFYLEMRLTDRWQAMYRFRLEPLTPIDFEVANWYTSTHPNSRFTQNLIVSRVVGEHRVSLANRKLVTRASDGSMSERELDNPPDLAQVLNEVMDLESPDAG